MLLYDKHYGAFFSVLGIGVGAVLLVMIYRENIERWFRRIQATQRLRSRAGRTKLKKRDSE